jgi:hypothetical protein
LQRAMVFLRLTVVKREIRAFMGSIKPFVVCRLGLTRTNVGKCQVIQVFSICCE